MIFKGDVKNVVGEHQVLMVDESMAECITNMMRNRITIMRSDPLHQVLSVHLQKWNWFAIGSKKEIKKRRKRISIATRVKKGNGKKRTNMMTLKFDPKKGAGGDTENR